MKEPNITVILFSQRYSISGYALNEQHKFPWKGQILDFDLLN